MTIGPDVVDLDRNEDFTLIGIEADAERVASAVGTTMSMLGDDAGELNFEPVSGIVIYTDPATHRRLAKPLDAWTGDRFPELHGGGITLFVSGVYDAVREMTEAE